MAAAIRILAVLLGASNDEGTGTASLDYATRMITAAGIIGAMNAWLRDEIPVTERELTVWLNPLLTPPTGDERV